MLKKKFRVCSIPAFTYVAWLAILVLSACNSGTNSNEDDAAYVSFTIPKTTDSGGGSVTAQQLQNVTSIIITVTDNQGNSVSGDIWKNGGELTLRVKAHVPLTITGVAYEGNIATYSGEATAGPLAPGQVAAISFSLTPIIQPTKPDPVVTPTNGAVNIPIDTTFTTDLSALGTEIASLTSASLTLTSGNSPAINTDFSPPETGFVFDFSLPAGTVLNPGTVYTASLQVEYTDNTENAQTYQYAWSFTTSNLINSTVFADSNLAACVEQTALENSAQSFGDIFVLSCIDDGINDLSGIEYLANLENLDLSENFISDITPLQYLSKLKFLYIGDCGECGGDNTVSDISSLSGLANLEELDFSNNRVTDIAALSGKNNLRIADFSGNEIIAVDLGGLPNLSSLNLYYNQIKTVNLRDDMPSLATLDLNYNAINSISFNGSFAQLTSLNLSDQYITDVSFVSSLTALSTLNLSGNNIKNLAPLQDNTSLPSTLTQLYLFDNNIEDATPLANLTSLSTLDLSNNNIVQGVDSLVGMTNAISIYLYGNLRMSCDSVQVLDNALDDGDGSGLGIVRWDTCFTDTPVSSLAFADAALSACVNRTQIANVLDLTVLDCSGSGITNLTGIDQLPFLVDLNLSNNAITNFTGLNNLRNLSTLNLNNSNVNYIYVVSTLKNLNTLGLDSNPFNFIGSSLGRLTNIQSLSLRNNLITSGLFDLEHLVNAQRIDLACSPVELENAIIDLDNVVDGGDGPYAGIVVWGCAVVTPTSGAVDVVVDTGFTADLSSIGENIASIDNATLILSSSTSPSITTEVTLPQTGLALSFNQIPGAELNPGTVYTANLHVEYSDIGGNAQTYDYTWIFTTVALIDLSKFSDSDLSACIEANMITFNLVYVTDVLNLSCKDSYVADLSGLETLPYIENLNLSGNSISNVAPLGFLPNLQVLDLSNCTRCDIGGAQSNAVADFSPLYGSQNLHELYVEDTGLTDLSLLSGISSLVSLVASYNNIDSISPNFNLANLQVLDLSWNQIVNLNWQQSLPQLTTLYAGNNAISSVQGLQNLPQLTMLDLQGNSLTSVNGISDLPVLTTLNLRVNSLTNLDGLTNLPQLADLNVGLNNIASIKGIQNLPQVKTFSAENNAISDTLDLNGVTSLVNVNLSQNKIRSMDLADLPNLNTLNLTSNLIVTASIVGSLDNLVRLNLSNNYLRNADFVANLPSLQFLELYFNLIEDVTPLAELATIIELGLSTNNVMYGVDLLSNLTNATYIGLSNNPAMPCAVVQGLDDALDGGDGSAAGTVIWNACFTDSAISSLVFPDSALSQCIASSGVINVSQLTSLACPSMGITDLAGMQSLTFLQQLDLSGNTISSNFASLTSLHNLKTLNLSNASIGNNELVWLSYLKNLEKLSLDSNLFTNVSYIDNLIFLTNISLTNSQIAVTSGQLLSLENLFNAQVIDLSCNPVGLEPDIIALDNVIDMGDGANTGVVIWGNVCP